MGPANKSHSAHGGKKRTKKTSASKKSKSKKSRSCKGGAKKHSKKNC